MIVKKNKDEIENFLLDASNYSGFCDAVYFPENEVEVKEILRDCNNNKIRVTFSGSGTGLTGARVPEGGVVISAEKLNKIIEINTEEKYAIVQPGVILREFQNEVESKGLFYPPDPTERDSFIGGNVLTNASGAKTFKYGPTRDYVESLKIILADGDSIMLTRGKCFAKNYKMNLVTDSGRQINFVLPAYEMASTKHTAGYYIKENMDAIDLFIGSEGTLGFVSEIKVRLIDLPGEILSCVCFFLKESDGFNFILEARDLSNNNSKLNEINKISARGLEFFDENSLDFLREDYPQIPGNAKAAVWFEQEVNEDNEESLFEEWLALLNKYNGDEENSWFASDPKEQEKFKDFRHAISWKVTEYITHNNVRKVGTDTAVPDKSFPDYFSFAKELVKKNSLDYVVYGHFGNNHMHLNMLPKKEEDYLHAKKVYLEMCKEAVRLGGTVSAEHGIGKLKQEYLLAMYGKKTVRGMAQVKLIFDPNKILGIGNIFDPSFLD